MNPVVPYHSLEQVPAPNLSMLSPRRDVKIVSHTYQVNSHSEVALSSKHMGCMIGEQHPQTANAGHVWLKH
jgi:hypothetical protein